jgi:hypothetical protein
VHPAEEQLIATFIVKEKRDRYRAKLSDSTKRTRFLDRLNHTLDLDERFAHWLPSNAPVVDLLREHGAPDSCYVLSADRALDGREMQLSDAVAEAAMRGWGTLISCVPAKLAYYYDECGERRALLVRGKH